MSNFLLDTHAFIWLTENDSNLRDDLRAIIDNADVVYLSIASLWEIAIKLKLGKLSLQSSYETIVSAIEASDILILGISFDDTVLVRNLPLHHGDPFDRMLIAQAVNHSLIIISRDTKFDAYTNVHRMWT
ncbi:type II toxin-antitoxin system VapC family toxin [Nostoc sp. LEGE 06077]|uniref:type II toxin-antitoxin system VapC family toxin n=1 Tax=Nostoc sp. LEGE 06077 TaxID=915325 RepID=UPI00187F79E5|nr:type II toxin-antitoxin system VapC family toxin [Nostoc sp. LEGE 06077]MBE9209674.1 type II toxin-antitoxin system VapC family toxin [Nostoc sp. LEGE 06077]